MTLGRRGPRQHAIAAVLALAVLIGTIATGTNPGGSPVAEAAPGGRATRYLPITPIRVLDTRDTRSGPKLGANETMSIVPVSVAVAAAAGVDPNNVEAVAINFVVVDTDGPGFATVWPTGEPRPDVSAVNNQFAGETVPNLVIVPLSANRRISIYTLAGAHVVIDVQGVFERSTSSSAGRFVPIVPSRALDTRGSPKIPANTSRVVDLRGQIPASASAAVLNVAATEPEASGYLTVWTAGAPRPDPAANVSFPAAGYTVSNTVLTGVTNGQISVYSLAATHIVVDVVGYMTGASGDLGTAGLYVPLAPRRLWDTRPEYDPVGSSAIGDKQTLTLSASGPTSSVPTTGVSAISMNLTMTRTLGAGYLEAFPSGTTRPDPFSSVNATSANQDVNNQTIVALGGVSPNRMFTLFAKTGSHAVVDITGYFLDGTTPPPNAPPDPVLVIPPNPNTFPTLPIPVPPPDADYRYLFDANPGTAPYTHPSGGSYTAWNPCLPVIKYAVNTLRATQQHIDTMNLAIAQIEQATGYDFQYVGEAFGSMDIRADSSGKGVTGFPTGTMAVIGFSDETATPILSGTTIGIGGADADLQSGPNGKSYFVDGGFAIADVNDVNAGNQLLTTLVHEMGHMMGLAHVFGDNGEIMRPVLGPQTTLGNGDKNGLYNLGRHQCVGSGALQIEGRQAPERASFWVAD